MSRKFVVAAWGLLLVAVGLFIAGALVNAWNVDRVFNVGVGPAVTVQCGSPDSPKISFDDQRELAGHIERQPEDMRAFVRAVVPVGCGLKVQVQKETADLLFVSGTSVAVCGGAAVAVWFFTRRRRAVSTPGRS